MSAELVFVILAIGFFLLDGFRVKDRTDNPRVSWTPLGFACVVIAVLLLPLI